eukprot:2158956-Amphidinium_carterae.2
MSTGALRDFKVTQKRNLAGSGGRILFGQDVGVSLCKNHRATLRFEHGDPSIPKPRPMKNVDVIRCAVSVTHPADVERILQTVKS